MKLEEIFTEQEEIQKFIEYCFKESLKDEDEWVSWDYYVFNYSEESSSELVIHYHLWKKRGDLEVKDYIQKSLKLSSKELSKFVETYKNFGS